MNKFAEVKKICQAVKIDGCSVGRAASTICQLFQDNGTTCLWCKDVLYYLPRKLAYGLNRFGRITPVICAYLDRLDCQLKRLAGEQTWISSLYLVSALSSSAGLGTSYSECFR